MYITKTRAKLKNLEALVLQDLLDGNEVATLTQLSLVDNAERSVANDFCVRVRDLSRGVRSVALCGQNCDHLTAILCCNRNTATQLRN